MKALLAFLGFGLLALGGQAREINLVQNGDFEAVDPSSRLPESYGMKGAVTWGYLGGADDFATHGIIFPGQASSGGAIGQLVRNIDQARGRWITFRFRGRAEDGFAVPDDSLKMKIEFYAKNGADYMDCASRPIYGEIERDRQNLAVNGVVFFNPFDAGMQDASNIMDFCCGHPRPRNQYHYHKYPICVNTPFVDKGDAPSQVIGFAFDGLPIYGPYQEAGIMAKDSATNPLNAFNACFDPVRGWHYHVTPGKFPYLIGGYFAKIEASNIDHPHRGGPSPGDFSPDGPPPPFGNE